MTREEQERYDALVSFVRDLANHESAIETAAEFERLSESGDLIDWSTGNFDDDLQTGMTVGEGRISESAQALLARLGL